jgi:alpha-D-xyloside xylohydrolase
MYLRWAQLGAVSPIMMEQNACFNPVGSREKWTLWSDEETTRVYADMARLHTRLLPYFTALAKEANASGIPLMRHPFLLFPGDPNVWSIEDAFFLGRALYAAPVVERGARERTVYLPAGARYLDLNTHVLREGGIATIPAPLDQLPLLLVEGEILPLLDASIETLAPATEPDVVTLQQVGDRLDVLVALNPNGDAAFTLSDGTLLTAIRVAEDAGNPAGLTFEEMTIGDVDGIRVEGNSIVLRDLRLEASARTVRWEVYRLP